MLVVQTIKFLWPFLKEMILGDKTLKEAVKHHISRVMLIGVILASIVLNFFTIPKLVALSYEHVELKRKYSAAIKQRWPEGDVDLDGPVPGKAKPVESPLPAASAPVDPSLERSVEDYRRAKEFFDRMREKERRYNNN